MWVGTLSAHDVLMLFSSKNKLDNKYATMSSSVMSLKFIFLTYQLSLCLSKSCEGHTNSTKGQRKLSELVCPSQDLDKCYHSLGLILFMMRQPANVTGTAITPHIMLSSIPNDKKIPRPPRVKAIFFFALVHFCLSVTLMLPTPVLQSLVRLRQCFQRSPWWTRHCCWWSHRTHHCSNAYR